MKLQLSSHRWTFSYKYTEEKVGLETIFTQKLHVNVKTVTKLQHKIHPKFCFIYNLI